MHTRSVVFAAALGALGAAFPLGAQTVPANKPTPTESTGLADAAKQRTEILNDVLSGSSTGEAALGKLRGMASPSGLPIDPEADFAVAAIDLGRRLVALQRPKEAEGFFQAAEQSLNEAIKRTGDTAGREKSQYLQIRAGIRASYLNKLAEARDDFDAALKLAPDNKQLQQMRRQLPADPAVILQNHKEPPVRG